MADHSKNFDEDEEMLTYLSENEDESGDDHFLINNRNEQQNKNENEQPKPEFTSHYQYRFESDSDSISEVFRTSPKNTSNIH